MNNRKPTLLLLALLLWSATTHADEFQSAGDAYKAGNYQEAFRINKELAEKGDASKQYLLGLMYDLGETVTQDDQQAAVWYGKAAEQGHVDAESELCSIYADGRGVPMDFKQAASWCRKAAEQGHADAQIKLGVMYSRGRGVTQDDVLAYRWYKQASEQGS